LTESFERVSKDRNVNSTDQVVKDIEPFIIPSDSIFDHSPFFTSKARNPSVLRDSRFLFHAIKINKLFLVGVLLNNLGYVKF